MTSKFGDQVDLFGVIILEWLGEQNLCTLAALDVSLGKNNRTFRLSLCRLTIYQPIPFRSERSEKLFLSWCKSRHVRLRYITISVETLWDLANNAEVPLTTYSTVHAVSVVVSTTANLNITPEQVSMIFPSVEHIKLTIGFGYREGQEVLRRPSSLISHPARFQDGKIRYLIIETPPRSHIITHIFVTLSLWIESVCETLEVLEFRDAEWSRTVWNALSDMDALPKLQELRIVPTCNWHSRYCSTGVHIDSDLLLTWIRNHQNLKVLIAPESKLDDGANGLRAIPALLQECPLLDVLEIHGFRLEKSHQPKRIIVKTSLLAHFNPILASKGDAKGDLLMISSSLFPTASNLTTASIPWHISLYDGRKSIPWWATLDSNDLNSDRMAPQDDSCLRELVLSADWKMVCNVVGKHRDTLEVLKVDLQDPSYRDLEPLSYCPLLSTLVLRLGSNAEYLAGTMVQRDVFPLFFNRHGSGLRNITLIFLSNGGSSSKLSDDIVQAVVVPILQVCPNLELLSVIAALKILRIQRLQPNVVSIICNSGQFHRGYQRVFDALVSFYCSSTSSVPAIELIDQTYCDSGDIKSQVWYWEEVLCPLLKRFGHVLSVLEIPLITISWEHMLAVLTAAPRLQRFQSGGITVDRNSLQLSFGKIVSTFNANILLLCLYQHFEFKQLSIDYRTRSREIPDEEMHSLLDCILSLNLTHSTVSGQDAGRVFLAHYYYECSHRWHHLQSLAFDLSGCSIELHRSLITLGYRMKISLMEEFDGNTIFDLVDMVHRRNDISGLELFSWSRGGGDMFLIKLLELLDCKRTCQLEEFKLVFHEFPTLVEGKAAIRQYGHHVTQLECRYIDHDATCYKKIPVDD